MRGIFLVGEEHESEEREFAGFRESSVLVVSSYSVSYS